MIKPHHKQYSILAEQHRQKCRRWVWKRRKLDIALVVKRLTERQVNCQSNHYFYREFLKRLGLINFGGSDVFEETANKHQRSLFDVDDSPVLEAKKHPWRRYEHTI